MTVTFIGDVHGWNSRLSTVLAQASGPLVFVGDLVDRGPEAPAVLDRVHARCANGEAQCLMGNHEWMLVRSLGRHDTPPNIDAFEAWIAGWGGDAVLAAFRVTTPEALKKALRPHWTWLSDLPWVLEGAAGERHWIAVHAGLEPNRPTAAQLAELRLGWAGPWAESADPRPWALFNKHRVEAVPRDLPAGTCVVSGHTPRLKALVTPSRILCDTSGGQPNRQLSAVEWSSGRVLLG